MINDKRTPGHIQIFGISLPPTGTIRMRHKLAATLTCARLERESHTALLMEKNSLKTGARFFSNLNSHNIDRKTRIEKNKNKKKLDYFKIKQNKGIVLYGK